MIINHRAVSLAVFGSLALSSASTIGGSSNALSSAASTDQHTKQQNRARRVKKAKSTIAADDLGVDQMSADNRVDGGADATSKKSSKADAPVATPVTPATTSGPTAMVENKINDEEEMVLPLNVANDTVVSEGGDSDELKPILTETFYMHHVPEGEDDSGGNETKAGGDDNVEGGGNDEEGVGGEAPPPPKPAPDNDEEEQVFCAADVFVCSDDPFVSVSRDPANDCAFPSCPPKGSTVAAIDGEEAAPPPKPARDNDEEEQVFCAADVFVCSEDPFVSVSRDPANDCAFPSCPPKGSTVAEIENKIYDEEEMVLPLNVANDTVVSEGGDSDELKPILTETFYMHHVPEGEDDSGGNETKAGGDDNVEGDGNIGNDTNVKPIGDNINFYEDYVPDEGVGADEEKDSSESDDIVYGASPRTIDIDPGTIETPTVSPTTPSPTHKPSNSPIVPPPPLPTNSPIVPPPTDEPTKAAVALPENSCFEENDVFVCIYYYEDLSCDKIVDGTFCNCCRYHPTEKFVSTFDCTNVGDEWGQMGLCEPGPMPIVEEKEDKILEEDGLSILSLDYGEDDNDMAADAISIAWSTAGGDVETDSKFVSLAVRQRRGRRRAQAVRRRAAATKKRREAMVK